MNYNLWNKELLLFKSVANGEEKCIQALKNLKTKLPEPIMDIGSGAGYISTNVFHDKEVINVDPLLFDDTDHKLPEKHIRLQKSFFDVNKIWDLWTVLFTHSMMYIDDPIERFHSQIEELRPEYIVTILNDNTWVLGNAIRFFEERKRKCCYEKHQENYLWLSYWIIEELPFYAEFNPSSFFELAEVISKLMMNTMLNEDKLVNFIDYLKTHIDKPNMKIEQTIRVYKRK